MLQEKVAIVNPMGLHARPAALLAKTAGRFSSEIKIIKRGVKVDAKSIMGILMLAAEHGSELTVTASGKDEAEAMAAVKEILARPSHEE